MTKKSNVENRNADQFKAEKKLNEICEMLSSNQSLIHDLTQEVQTCPEDGITNLNKSLVNLHGLYLQFQKSEEKFHEAYSAGKCSSDIDFDEVRAEIGSRLDRIRATRDTAGVSGEPQ